MELAERRVLTAGVLCSIIMEQGHVVDKTPLVIEMLELNVFRR